MADRDMVIKSIENCLHKKECDDCSYEGCIHAHGNCIGDLMAHALELLKEPSAKDTNVPSKWIDVKDKLPENTDTVLIAHKSGVSFGWYNGRYWERGASTKHREIRTVSHWMPLPEPPEVIQNDRC